MTIISEVISILFVNRDGKSVGVNFNFKLIKLDLIQIDESNLGIFFFRSVIVSENSHHFLNQSDAKLTPSTNWSPVFSCVLSGLLGCYFLQSKI